MNAREVIGVDPGDVHTGVALFRWADPDTKPLDWDGWECWHAEEEAGFEFASTLDTMLGNPTGAPFPDVLVVERFQLYAHKAAEQIGSEFETVQLIGAIRYLVEANNDLARFNPAEELGTLARRPVDLVMQQAAVKNGTKAFLRRHKVESMAKLLKVGGHAFDAELHGWHVLINYYTRNGGQP